MASGDDRYQGRKGADQFELTIKAGDTDVIEDLRFGQGDIIMRFAPNTFGDDNGQITSFAEFRKLVQGLNTDGDPTTSAMLGRDDRVDAVVLRGGGYTLVARDDNDQPRDNRCADFKAEDLAIGDGEAVFFEFRDKADEGKRIGNTDAAAADNTRAFDFGEDAVGRDTTGLIVEGFKSRAST